MGSMKKIAIVGSYNGTSIGDTAILLGLLSSIERVYGDSVCVNVLVMSPVNLTNECASLGIGVSVNEIVITEFHRPSNLKEIFPLIYKKVVNKLFSGPAVKSSTLKVALSSVDHLIIGGGNLIMDLFPNHPHFIQVICDFAISQKVKYSFVGVGAGPINTKLGRNIFQNSLQNAEHIFFRDKKSLSLAQDYFSNLKFALMPDLALGIDTTQNSSIDNSVLLINVASVYGQGWLIQNKDKFEDYIQNLVEITKEIIKLNEFDKLILFYSNYPLDTFGGEAYLAELENEDISVEVINRKLKVSEIISLGRGAKLALVTRLHAGIMAYLGGASIAAVAYQPKVADVLADSGISIRIFDMDFKNRGEVIHEIVDSMSRKPKEKSRTTIESIDRVLTEILDVE